MVEEPLLEERMSGFADVYAVLPKAFVWVRGLAFGEVLVRDEGFGVTVLPLVTLALDDETAGAGTVDDVFVALTVTIAVLLGLKFIPCLSVMV